MSNNRSKVAMLGLATAAGGAILGFAGISAAQSPSPAPPAVSAPAAPSSPEQHGDGPDAGADTPDAGLSAKAKITEAQAIEAALRAQPDGKVVKAEVQDEDGTIVWGVELSTPTGPHEVKFNATTGALIKNEVDASEAGDGSDTAQPGDAPDTPGSATTKA